MLKAVFLLNGLPE